MKSAPSRSAELLNRIAAALGVPVETFSAPNPQPTADAVPSALVATLIFDPDGRRFVAAFPALSPQLRRSFADNAEALVATAVSPEDAG
ncbi:hypothetical protein MKK84_24585 [Methylobacterium sp. E-065]|uniref:hypothetical protein n=1 Tax=Methylobacterium sp. E-065 TaxID=2836583 RepID=UPI001FBB7F79|nr:hypothetical protein [Methylobacterium sp. E-065]MCJ2020566.1 hypothetical protein [Methylobacterium sp. E-065]